MEAMASTTSLKWLLLAAVTNTKSAILSGVRGWKESLGGMKLRRASSLALNGMLLLVYCRGSFSETFDVVPTSVMISDVCNNHKCIIIKSVVKPSHQGRFFYTNWHTMSAYHVCMTNQKLINKVIFFRKIDK